MLSSLVTFKIFYEILKVKIQSIESKSSKQSIGRQYMKDDSSLNNKNIA